jgi:hypothetical protein
MLLAESGARGRAPYPGLVHKQVVRGAQRKRHYRRAARRCSTGAGACRSASEAAAGARVPEGATDGKLTAAAFSSFSISSELCSAWG